MWGGEVVGEFNEEDVGDFENEGFDYVEEFGDVQIDQLDYFDLCVEVVVECELVELMLGGLLVDFVKCVYGEIGECECQVGDEQEVVLINFKEGGYVCV